MKLRGYSPLIYRAGGEGGVVVGVCVLVRKVQFLIKEKKKSHLSL